MCDKSGTLKTRSRSTCLIIVKCNVSAELSLETVRRASYCSAWYHSISNVGVCGYFLSSSIWIWWTSNVNMFTIFWSCLRFILFKEFLFVQKKIKKKTFFFNHQSTAEALSRHYLSREKRAYELNVISVNLFSFLLKCVCVSIERTQLNEVKWMCLFYW